MTQPLQVLRDRLILIQCRQGKDEGFEALVGAYERPLFYYVRRLLDREEDCWDALQDVWVRAFRSIRTVRQAETLSAWLYRVARNAAADQRRRSGTWDALPEDGDPAAPAADAPDAELSGGFSAREIHQALGELPLPEREALTLYFLEGFLIREIAEITGAPEGTVKARLHWAKRHLRAILQEGGR